MSALQLESELEHQLSLLGRVGVGTGRPWASVYPGVKWGDARGRVKGAVHMPRGKGQAGGFELFMSAIFHLIFWDRG